jgi:hypothetical protein
MKGYIAISQLDVFIFANRESWRMRSTLAPKQERSTYGADTSSSKSQLISQINVIFIQ